MPDGTRTNVAAYEIACSPDFDEFSVGAVHEIDVSSLGGYPVRRIEIVSGSGTLSYQTARGGTAVNKVATVAAGDKLGPAQITSIRGTTDTTVDKDGAAAPSSGVTKIRVFK